MGVYKMVLEEPTTGEIEFLYALFIAGISPDKAKECIRLCTHKTYGEPYFAAEFPTRFIEEIINEHNN